MATIVAPGINDTLLSGTSGDDYLYGNGGNDTLEGLAGNDYLSGGAGADSLIGGIGNDTYLIDNIGDIVVENAGEGTDTVEVPFSLDLNSTTQLGGYLANVENFVLRGTGPTFGIGSSASNSIMGSGYANTLDGGAGNDTIDGNGGNDTIYGGLGNDSLFGDIGNDSLMGDAGSDTLSGGSGNDCLVGGVEADYMTGGAGNDSYSVDNTGDVVSETTNQGTDIIYSSVDYTIPANVEALVLTGTAKLNATGGNVTNDSLVGNAGNNILTGLGENDTLMGGEIIKSTNGGNDDTLGGNDTLLGGNGNDSLIGGPGVDSLIGGLGNDTYEVSFDSRVTVTDTNALFALTAAQVINGDFVFQYDPSNPALSILWNVVDINNALPAARFANTGRSPFIATDVIVEDATLTEVDLVKSSATYTLGANLENLTLIGSASVNGTGNTQDNVLTGNIGNNSLDGSGGNDTLDGSFGTDTLIGGAGNDYYILNSEVEDTTIELAGGGTDTVQSSVNFSLLNRPTFSQIENLVLTGTAILGKGNALDNSVSGYTTENRLTLANDNQLSGGAGADSLYGGLGADLLDGGIGNDMLVGGTNTIFGGDSTLDGGIDTDTLNGNDQLLGGDGSDSLDGGFGNDILKGGQGGLIGLVGTGDILLGGAGNDLLLGGTNGFPGQTDRDLIFPNDTLVGGTGNDTLDGGNGLNSLIGGLGNDLIYIRSAGDIAVELPGEGIDTLIGNQTLDLSVGGNYANFEAAAIFGINAVNLTGNDESQLLMGNDGASVFDIGYGIFINNVITGNGGNDTILGGAGLDYIWGDDILGLQSGNDCLDGGTSESPTLGDTMDGGLGNDTYIVDNVNDRVLESQPVDDGGIDAVLTYVNFDPLPASDTNNVTRQPSFANLDIASFGLIENFVLMDDALRGVGVPIRGVGNALGNEFTGNAENNVILGLGGDDTILGNAGNDSLYGDRDIETPVYDPVSGTYPSNPGAYDISNLSLADQALLVGVGGALENGFDSLVGGDGDDGMWGQGEDDTLIGGSGNDCLMGGTGADSMVGGVGNDAFYVDTYEDVVVELAGEGVDRVLSTVDIYRLQDNVDNLTIYGAAILGVGNDLDNAISVSQVGLSVQPVTLSGGAGNDTIEGFYSSPAGAQTRNADDYLTGGSGNDWVDGGQGADVLEGGLGNDTLVVDDAGDAMREYGYSGNPSVGDTDLVISSITGPAGIVLSDTAVDGGMFIENLTMQDNGGALNGTGNRLNNVVTGNQSDNILTGALGNDTIYGGDILLDYNFDGNDTIDGGAGDDFIRAGSVTSLQNSEIDEITGGAGANTFALSNDAGSGFYRNITEGADDFGDSSYVVLNDSGKLLLQANPTVTWKFGIGTSNGTGYYVAKDLTGVGSFVGGYGIFVSTDPTTNNLPTATDDLIAAGPGLTTFASAQAAINTATYI